MNVYQVNRPVVIRRGKLVVPANDGELGPPGSGATITIFDSTANTNNVGNQIVGIPFSRLQLNLESSHDSAANGLVYQSSFDALASHFRNQTTYTYSAAGGPFTYDLRMAGDHAKITYQNSANVLTIWEFVLLGLYDRNPGV